jgi:hypothetical protein
MRCESSSGVIIGRNFDFEEKEPLNEQERSDFQRATLFISINRSNGAPFNVVEKVHHNVAQQVHDDDKHADDDGEFP